MGTRRDEMGVEIEEEAVQWNAQVGAHVDRAQLAATNEGAHRGGAGAQQSADLAHGEELRVHDSGRGGCGHAQSPARLRATDQTLVNRESVGGPRRRPVCINAASMRDERIQERCRGPGSIPFPGTVGKLPPTAAYEAHSA